MKLITTIITTVIFACTAPLCAAKTSPIAQGPLAPASNPVAYSGPPMCSAPSCSPCMPTCDPCCAPSCGTECGVSTCAIAVAVTAVVAAAAIILASSSENSHSH